MAAGKHNVAAVVHGLRAWRVLLLPSIIGERAPALSTLVLYHCAQVARAVDVARSSEIACCKLLLSVFNTRK